MTLPLTGDPALAVVAILDFIGDLVTASPREGYSRTDVLLLLQHVRDDQDFIDPAAVIEFQSLPEVTG